MCLSMFMQIIRDSASHTEEVSPYETKNICGYIGRYMIYEIIYFDKWDSSAYIF